MLTQRHSPFHTQVTPAPLRPPPTPAPAPRSTARRDRWRTTSRACARGARRRAAAGAGACARRRSPPPHPPYCCPYPCPYCTLTVTDVRQVKLFLDGVPDNRTAWMLAPYAPAGPPQAQAAAPEGAGGCGCGSGAAAAGGAAAERRSLDWSGRGVYDPSPFLRIQPVLTGHVSSLTPY